LWSQVALIGWLVGWGELFPTAEEADAVRKEFHR